MAILVAFDKHYFEAHVPIAKKIPGLRKYEVGQGPVATPGGPEECTRLQRGQAIQRAHDVPDGVGGEAHVERVRIELRVPQKNITRISMSCSSRCVAKLCRRVLAISAIWAAAWQARLS